MPRKSRPTAQRPLRRAKYRQNARKRIERKWQLFKDRLENYSATKPDPAEDRGRLVHFGDVVFLFD